MSTILYTDDGTVGSSGVPNCVGVGTANPATTLDVLGGESHFAFNAYTDPNPGVACDAKFGGSAGGIAVNGESVFNGAVGIGTTTPGQTLEVNGTIGTNSALITPALRPVTDATNALRVQTANGSTDILDVDTTNGRIGINTDSPAQALDVVGNIRTNGYVDVDGPRIISGTGNPTTAPALSAPKGSLYLRTDATTATTRIWINTNGTTGWAYVTASA
jgi:hypothetical protein